MAAQIEDPSQARTSNLFLTAKVHACPLGATYLEANVTCVGLFLCLVLSRSTFCYSTFSGANRSLVIPSFMADMSSLSESERHLLGERRRSFSTGLSANSEARRLFPGLHKVVVIMLPLSLVLLVFGWIFGFVSSLVRIPRMLVGSASYILFCSKSQRVSCWCWFCGASAGLCDHRGKAATASRPRCPHIMAGVNIRCCCA